MLVWVYTCQNATLLEINCRNLFVILSLLTKTHAISLIKRERRTGGAFQESFSLIVDSLLVVAPFLFGGGGCVGFLF